MFLGKIGFSFGWIFGIVARGFIEICFALFYVRPWVTVATTSVVCRTLCRSQPVKMILRGSQTDPGLEPPAPTHGSREANTKTHINQEKLDISAPIGTRRTLTPDLVDRLTMLTLSSSSTASTPANNHHSLTSNNATCGRTSAFVGSSTVSLSAAAERSCSQQKDDTNQEPSLMEQMMTEAMAAREEGMKKEQTKNRDRAKKDFGKGLKKGFLGGGSSAVARNRKAKAGAREAKRDSIPTITGRKTTSGSRSELEFDLSIKASTSSSNPGLVLPEVQEAMNEANQNNLGSSSNNKSNSHGLAGTEWLTPELLDKISQRPRLAAMLMNPRFAQAMQLMSTSPQEAKALFASSPEAQETFSQLSTLLAEHFTTMGKAADARAAAADADRRKVADGPLAQEALRKAAAGVGIAATTKPSPAEKADVERVLEQPELRELLMDPGMQRVLQECEQPSNLAQYMRHPEFGPKLQLMARAGLVSFRS